MGKSQLSNLGKHLRQWRRTHQISLGTMARQAGLSPGQLFDMEVGNEAWDHQAVQGIALQCRLPLSDAIKLAELQSPPTHEEHP